VPRVLTLILTPGKTSECKELHVVQHRIVKATAEAAIDDGINMCIKPAKALANAAVPAASWRIGRVWPEGNAGEGAAKGTRRGYQPERAVPLPGPPGQRPAELRFAAALGSRGVLPVGGAGRGLSAPVGSSGKACRLGITVLEVRVFQKFLLIFVAIFLAVEVLGEVFQRLERDNSSIFKI